MKVKHRVPLIRVTPTTSPIQITPESLASMLERMPKEIPVTIEVGGKEIGIATNFKLSKDCQCITGELHITDRSMLEKLS